MQRDMHVIHVLRIIKSHRTFHFNKPLFFKAIDILANNSETSPSFPEVVSVSFLDLFRVVRRAMIDLNNKSINLLPSVYIFHLKRYDDKGHFLTTVLRDLISFFRFLHVTFF